VRIVTGERVTTPEAGFNPTWQRHVAAYRLAAELLPPGRVLDLGCGVGHSYELLAPRETVGLDSDAATLEGQARPTVAADMRELPFADGEFASVLAVQSIEHVPDPTRVLAEAARVLEPGGAAVLVTPNRLTFARPDEIIDPYHYVEYDPEQLRSLCAAFFEDVRVAGIFGSPRYLELVGEERRRLDSLLRRDPLRLRRLVPRRARKRLYDRRLSRERRHADPRALAIEPGDFRLGDSPLEQALDLVAICRAPRS
jgi:SAM-dependent methyltransferase